MNATASPQPSTWPARPVTRAAACEKKKGGGRGGDDNDDLPSRGQHDHIQSPAPQRAYKRLCWRLFHSLLDFFFFTLFSSSPRSRA